MKSIKQLQKTMEVAQNEINIKTIIHLYASSDNSFL